MLRPLLPLLCAAGLLLASTAVQAGRPCTAVPLKVAEVQAGLDLAIATENALNASGANVVLLARVGQDLSEYNLRYSHLGFAYREQIGADVRWRVLHKLNQCDTSTAGVYRQGLGQFFLDNLWRYEAAYVVPSPAVQAKLQTFLSAPDALTAMHEPSYSMVSYVWSTQFQQSNQWVLESFAAALDPAIHNRAAAQAWLKQRDYRGSILRLGTFKRLGARITTANVSFDDHPNRKRFSGRIETVTVDSMFAWLQQAGFIGPVVPIDPP
jgi:hypothetical protein